jgi:hypothetical protein
LPNAKELHDSIAKLKKNMDFLKRMSSKQEESSDSDFEPKSKKRKAEPVATFLRRMTRKQEPVLKPTPTKEENINTMQVCNSHNIYLNL